MPIVRKEQKVDNWSVLIRGAQGKAGNIFGNTGNFIDQTNVPDVKIEKMAIAPGLVRGLFGGKRDFLVISETGNSNLAPYQMFIGARDYGDNLDVSWYLTYRIGYGEKAWASLLKIPILNILLLPFALMRGFGRLAKVKKVGFELDLFDEQDLRAYATNVHHCLLQAVDKLMLELNQDPSKIDRKSRGFLGIS